MSKWILDYPTFDHLIKLHSCNMNQLREKCRKARKLEIDLGILTRKWKWNIPTFEHLHSHSLKATWIRWEKRKSRILLIWNVETLIIPLSISGSIKLIKLHFSCQALVRASMFIGRHHTGGSFQKKHNCQNENYFCDLEYDLILSLAWSTGMYSPPKSLWAETVRRSHQWHLGSDFWKQSQL